jgi:hypothetical protein
MFGVANGVISMIFLPLMILYAAYILKRLYKLTFGEIVVRTLLFMAILGIVMVIATIIVVVIMFMTGDMQEMIEAQRAAIDAAKQAKG